MFVTVALIGMVVRDRAWVAKAFFEPAGALMGAE
jgi:hypothetical protein